MSSSATADGRESLCIVRAVIVAVAPAVSDLPLALRHLRLDGDEDDAHTTTHSDRTTSGSLSSVGRQLASVCGLAMTLALPQELVSHALRVAALLALVDADEVEAILARPLVAELYGRLKGWEASLRRCRFTDDVVGRGCFVVVIFIVIVVVRISDVAIMVTRVDGQLITCRIVESGEVGHTGWYGDAVRGYRWRYGGWSVGVDALGRVVRVGRV